MNVPFIQVSHASQSFKVGDEVIPVLKDVSFDIHENSFNVIFGPSGSGKSTLLNVLAGLQRPTQGDVMFDGQNIYNFTPDELAYLRANRIGFVYQTNYWVKSLNVLENVAMSLHFSGLGMRKAAPVAHQALEHVGMAHAAKKSPLVLSGGEQQRVALARALVTNPLFIIADEPTGNLDSKNGDAVMRLLKGCQVNLKRTVILVTHNMEYLPLANHLLRIDDGRVQEMRHDSFRVTTDHLLQDLRDRINDLAKTKFYEESADVVR